MIIRQSVLFYGAKLVVDENGAYLCGRLTDNLVALKEIRLEHEEGAPCTAIREGKQGLQ